MAEAPADEAELQRRLLAALGEVLLVERESQVAVFEDEVLSGVVVSAARSSHFQGREYARAPGRRDHTSPSCSARLSLHGILHSADVYAHEPMARLSEHGLRKSVGVSGMFATAYGNVGSSIYYALGLVAAHALGLTPLVFLFAGGLFALTAKTYAEGASMFPEAGGSSSFARHAFDDVVVVLRRLGAEPRLHPHDRDLGVLRAALPERVPRAGRAQAQPRRHLRRADRRRAARGAEHPRARASRRSSTSSSRSLDLSTQILLVAVGVVLVLNPSLLVHQVHLGIAPTWKELIFALSLAMLAYTGIETVANMAEESRDPGRQVPKAVNLVVLAVLGVYAGHLGRRALGAAGDPSRRRLQRRAQTELHPARAMRPRSAALLRKRPGARRDRTPRACTARC